MMLWALLRMARLLHHLIEAPRPCSYLAYRQASLEHQVLLDVTPLELEAMIVRGWRRFGPQYFRPACAPCSDCVPTRVPTRSFAPSKSQRRAKRACRGLRAVLGTPRVDTARLALYHRWHASREQARDWEASPLDDKAYFLQFAFPHPAARELAYYAGDGEGARLVGVGICDETPNAWSAVYFFYDPEWGKQSIGVANVIFQIELARQRAIPHVYLGFRISECASMRYKARFLPQERLVAWPDPEQEPRWVSVDPRDQTAEIDAPSPPRRGR